MMIRKNVKNNNYNFVKIGNEVRKNFKLVGVGVLLVSSIVKAIKNIKK